MMALMKVTIMVNMKMIRTTKTIMMMMMMMMMMTLFVQSLLSLVGNYLL